MKFWIIGWYWNIYIKVIQIDWLIEKYLNLMIFLIIIIIQIIQTILIKSIILLKQW